MIKKFHVILLIIISFNLVYAQDILQKVKQHAPVLSFHPNEGKQCCYPDDAEKAYKLIKKGKFHKMYKPKKLNKQTPCYYQYWKGIDIYGNNAERLKYWFWYNFNDYPTGPDPFGSHEGDWEGLEVVIINNLVHVYLLSNHDSFIIVFPKNAKFKNGRIKIWVANGSHANYPSPYSKPYTYAGFPDEIADKGKIWDTGICLKAIKETNFKNFYGKWGNHNIVIDLFFKKFVFDPPRSPVGRQFDYSYPNIKN